MIERCTDYRRIKKFPEWRMCISNDFYYLMEIKDDVDLGVWTFHPCLEGDTENLTIHASLGDGCRGKEAMKSARDAFHWIFTNTDFKRIYAIIPHNKRHAQFMASWSGMKLQSADEKDRYYKIDFYDVITAEITRRAV